MQSRINLLYACKKHSSVNEFISSRAGANTDGLPAGVLYQVKASYRYQAEDVDELNFDVGEVINVVEYDDPEDQVRKTFITCQEFRELCSDKR